MREVVCTLNKAPSGPPEKLKSRMVPQPCPEMGVGLAALLSQLLGAVSLQRGK